MSKSIERIEKRLYKKRTKKNRDIKPKLNIDYLYFFKLICLVAIFIIISNSFLLYLIFTGDITSYTNSKIRQFTLFGKFASDWIMIIIFFITIWLGKSKIAYGYFWCYFWMILLLLFSVLPFVTATIMPKELIIKNTLMLVNNFGIIWVLLLFANDIRWFRKRVKKSKEREKYV